MDFYGGGVDFCGGFLWWICEVDLLGWRGGVLGWIFVVVGWILGVDLWGGVLGWQGGFLRWICEMDLLGWIFGVAGGFLGWVYWGGFVGWSFGVDFLHCMNPARCLCPLCAEVLREETQRFERRPAGRGHRV